MTESREGEIPRSLALAAGYAWRLLVVVAAALLLVYVLVTLRLIFIPVVVALLISTLLVPLAERLRGRGLPSLLATWVVMLGALGLVATIVSLVAPAIAGELDNLGREVEEGFEDVVAWLTTGPLDLTRADVDRYIDQIAEQLRERRSAIIAGAFRGAYVVAEIVVGTVLTLVLTFFFVKDGHRIASALLGLFPERRQEDLRTMAARSWASLAAYIRGTAVVGLVDAAAIGGTMLVLGVPLVAPIAVITFFAAFFPLVGAVVAGVIASLVALVTNGFVPALILAAATVVVQQVEGDVLQPLVLGRAVRLHPLVILLSLTAGSIVAGIAGAFLAVPTAAVVAVVVAYLRGEEPHTIAEEEKGYPRPRPERRRFLRRVVDVPRIGYHSPEGAAIVLGPPRRMERPAGHAPGWSPRHRRLVGVAAIVVVVSTLPARGAAPRAPSGTWSEIRGAGTAAAAGDVNGDGHPDVVVSRGDLAQPPSRGRTWVIFGPWPRGRVQSTADLGSSGFVIDGASDDDLASSSRAAGDVNGDGLDDAVVGAEMAGTDERPASGAAYVVFGKTDSTSVHLAAFDDGTQTGGFRITGPGEFSLAGHEVAGLGDVNGDGLDDVAVAAPFAGAVYVVFGKTSTAPVDLQLFDVNAQGSAGYRIGVPAPDYSDGMTVGGGGDVNGDGTPDVVIGSIPDTYDSPGAAYVVFGKPTPEPVSVVALGARGFAITGVDPGDATGYSVADAGDVNEDGFADVIVGSPRINFYSAGGAAVIFGEAVPTDVRLAEIGDRGFRIRGGSPGENAGNSVAGVADVNGDGTDDVAIGARDASRHDREFSGSVYVLYGRASTRPVRLRHLRDRGFRVDGVFGAPRRCDRPDWAYCPPWFGYSVDGIDDVDGDGRNDLVVGAYGEGRRRLGRSYVIRGR